MAILNPPLTDQPSLDFTMLEIVREINILQQQNLRLIQDIRNSTNFADLQVRIDKKW